MAIFLVISVGDRAGNIRVTSLVGTTAMWCMAILVILDIVLLLVKHVNSRILTVANLMLSMTIFLVMENAFVNDYFSIDYVRIFSEAGMPLIYKIVAIWAGEAGSIITWLVLNTAFIFAYRLKNRDGQDRVFLFSLSLAQAASLVIVIIALALNPFWIEPHPSTEGDGLVPTLQTPYMIWHPLFVFLAYATFLLPFTGVIARSVVRRRQNIQGSYERNFLQFSMKLGWLVLTLGIGVGAYWARTTLGWGGYWVWDPVETVTLIPWIFSTSCFHTVSFTKEKEKIARINVALVFVSIIFATAITRGGSVISVHAFTGSAELVLLAVISGVALLALSFYVIYFIIDVVGGEYKNHKLLFDDLTYFFLFMIAFICAIGLIVSPITSLASVIVSIIPFDLYPSYYSLLLILPAGGLSIALVFCSLLNIYPLKKVGLVIIVATCALSGYSVVMYYVSGVLVNPVLAFYLFALIAACIVIFKNVRKGTGPSQFFKLNSRHIVHAGLSLILIGTVTTNVIFQDLVFIPGFFVMIAGIVPSLVASFLKGASPQEILQSTTPTPEEIGASRGR